MVFPEVLSIDRQAALRILGYGDNLPDPATARLLEEACIAVELEAQPRWTWRALPLDQASGPIILPIGLFLPGRDIAAHLAGCDGCILLGLTLGTGVDTLLRARSTADPAGGLMADAAASAMAEQYADLAESLLRAETQAVGRYLTQRFSPGYGDLPLALQNAIVGLMDGPRAIGLTVSGSHIMMPRKSITAIIGSAAHPVVGKLAGCDTCALKEGCEYYQRGWPCAKLDT